MFDLSDDSLLMWLSSGYDPDGLAREVLNLCHQAQEKGQPLTDLPPGLTPEDAAGRVDHYLQARYSTWSVVGSAGSVLTRPALFFQGKRPPISQSDVPGSLPYLLLITAGQGPVDPATLPPGPWHAGPVVLFTICLHRAQAVGPWRAHGLASPYGHLWGTKPEVQVLLEDIGREMARPAEPTPELAALLQGVGRELTQLARPEGRAERQVSGLADDEDRRWRLEETEQWEWKSEQAKMFLAHQKHSGLTQNQAAMKIRYSDGRRVPRSTLNGWCKRVEEMNHRDEQ